MTSNTQDKLLSDSELRSHILNDWLVHDEDCTSSLTDGPCTCIQRRVAENLMHLIRSQKIAHANMVIGNYSDYPSHYGISDVLHDQRERNV